MSSKKIFASILIVTALLALQVGSVFAAPAAQTTTPPTINGTITAITLGTDSTGATIVQVTYTDPNGVSQTMDLSITDAASLGLIQTDTSGNPVLDANGNPIINTSMITGSDIVVNPVASILGDFFGLDPTAVMEWHQDGAGFGVIAQSCFIAQELGGGAACKDVLDAKTSGDYASLMPAGYTGPVPTNWGQFKKFAFQNSVIEGTKKSLTNLGAVVSKRATPQTSVGGDTGGGTGSDLGGASSMTTLGSTPKDHGNGLDKTHGKGNGRGHGKGNNK